MTHPSAAGAVPPSRHRVALALVVATAAALSSGAAIARQDKARKPVEETPRGPMTLIVSIADQSLSVYDGEERIARVPVSTGQKGYETPTGVFSIIQKNRIHFSNLYNEAPMPFMQRITWSGVALHAGNLPGYPASHGCIRMPHDFAQHLFGQTRMGARVIVSRSGTAPERFSHAILAAASIAPRAQVARSDASPASAPVLLMRLGATSPETAAAGTGTAAVVHPVTGTDPATAPPAEPPVPSFLREAMQRVEESAEAIRTTREAKDTASTGVPEIAAAADQSRAALLETRREVADARRILEGVQAETARVKDRLARILRDGETAPESADALLAMREDELEARLLALLDQATDAQLQLAMLEGETPEIEERYLIAHQRRIAALRELNQANAALLRAEEEHAEAKRALARRHLPIHMLVSRKTGKLHVRQGFAPLIELDVEITDRSEPIGTHVFTVLAADESGLRWNAVSVPEAAPVAPAATPRKKDSRPERIETPLRRVAPREALDRVRIPPETMAKLGELMKPGSSLIVSDHGISHETGRGTDLIVLTR